MEKFTEFIERHVAPVAGRLGANRYIQAIQNTFLTLIPFMTIGSMALVIVTPPMDYTTMDPGIAQSFMQGWQAVADFLAFPFTIINAITTGCLALWVSVGLAFFLSRHYKMNSYLPVALSAASFIATGFISTEGALMTDFIGGAGLFCAIVMSVATVELFKFLSERNVGRINLPGAVPPALGESMAHLVPAALCLLAVSLISTAAIKLTAAPFANLIATIVSPLVGAVDSPAGIMLIAFLMPLFFWFGIHDSVLTSPLDPFLYANLDANMAAYAAGAAATALPCTVTPPFVWYFITIGGNGATLALALLTLRSRSKQISTIGKLGIIPTLFGVNEPIIFGLPVMYNPLMFVPSILNMVLNAGLTFLVMDLGIINHTFAYPGWNVPAPIGALLSTMDVKALVFIIGLIILNGLVYYPFFKAYEKKKVEEEQAEAPAQAEVA